MFLNSFPASCRYAVRLTSCLLLIAASKIFIFSHLFAFPLHLYILGYLLCPALVYKRRNVPLYNYAIIIFLTKTIFSRIIMFLYDKYLSSPYFRKKKSLKRIIFSKIIIFLKLFFLHILYSYAYWIFK